MRSRAARREWFGTKFIIRQLILIACVFLQVYVSYPMRDFTTALHEMDAEAFYQGVAHFTTVAMLAAPLFAFDSWAGGRLNLLWRQIFTKAMFEDYFEGQAFFHVSQHPTIDNPGQRILDDVHDYCYSVMGILELVIQQTCQLLGFSYVLMSIESKFVPLLILYAGFGTTVVVCAFGRKLRDLAALLLLQSASVRSYLVRVKENSESIAFFRAEAFESFTVWTMFMALIRTHVVSIKWTAYLACFKNAYRYITICIPYIMLAPTFFKGGIKFGEISQAAVAFRTLLDALNLIISKLTTLTSLSATTDRISALQNELARIHAANRKGLAPTLASVDDGGFDDGDESGFFKKKKRRKKGKTKLTKTSDDSDEENEDRNLLGRVTYGGEEVDVELTTVETGTAGSKPVINMNHDGRFVVKNLEIKIPGRDKKLVSGLTCDFSEGSVLVVGPSGAGKSSLFRVLSGLWSPSSGTIDKPPMETIFFVPQKPYMPIMRQNTRRAQLLFPSSPNGDRLPQDEVESLLRELNLSHIRDFDRSLAPEDQRNPLSQDWSRILSLGEQQRLSFGRVFVNRPRLVFLDESTSALDPDNERNLYSNLRKSGVPYISIGHRNTLLDFHDRVLIINGDSTWRLVSTKEYRKEQADKVLGETVAATEEEAGQGTTRFLFGRDKKDA